MENLADYLSSTQMYIPVDVEDCLRELSKILPAALVGEIRSCAENDLAKYHFGLGMWLSNNWGFWMDESRLRKYFVGLGIANADNMTRIILTSYWGILNGRSIDIRRRIVYNRIDRDQIRGGSKPIY